MSLVNVKVITKDWTLIQRIRVCFTILTGGFIEFRKCEMLEPTNGG